MTDTDIIANIGALIEDRIGGYDSLRELQNKKGEWLSLSPYGDFQIVDISMFNRGTDDPNPNVTYPEIDYPKMVTLRDSKGNIFVHFNGTGDGNWGYNDVAFGGAPSPMQEWSLKHFNEVYEKYCEGQSINNLYITGHSQGGNNAQYATIRSPYADAITMCVNLNGPMFSHQFAEESIPIFGEAFYERQRIKIWGYYTELNYVDQLGQESMVPDGQIRIIKFTNPLNALFDFMNFHMAGGMIDNETGLMTVYEPKRPILDANGNVIGYGYFDDEFQFRDFISKVVEKVNDLPPEKLEILKKVSMQIAENNVGANEPIKDLDGLGSFEDFKKIIVPILVDVLAENPDSIELIAKELGLGDDTSALLGTIIKEFNSLPESIRIEALTVLASLIQLDENGNIKINSIGLFELLGLAPTVVPIVLETALLHPDQLIATMKELGVDKMIANWLQNNPVLVVAGILGCVLFPGVVGALATLAGGLIAGYIIGGLLVDAIAFFVEKAIEVAKDVGHFVLNCLQAIKNTITKIVEFLRSISAGVRYAAANPYFKVDTAKLRAYATRINNVNNRLRNLDSSLRSCFWQVPIWEMWRFAWINMLTSGSPTLNQVKSYLNNSADRLETTENKARGYVGG